MKRHLIWIVLFILVSPLSAIAHEPPKNYADLITDLTAAGGIIETDGEISQPFFSVKGRRISLNGGEVEIFEYPSHTKATAEARLISPDGGSVGSVRADWKEKPHFYNSGKLIILYLGDSQAIQSLIESVVGTQFAGK